MKNKFNISVSNSYDESKSSIKLSKICSIKEIKEFLNFVFDYLKINNSEVSIIFTDTEEIREMNQRYRNIDQSTDVLSFSSEDADLEDKFIVGIKRHKYLGDIAVCPEICNQNAEEYNVPVKTELLRLVVHGVLHLYGYDHKTNEETENMLILQEEILKTYFSDFKKDNLLTNSLPKN